LGSDIEGAVLSSIKKSALVKTLQSEALKMIDEIVSSELNHLSGVNYYDRLFKLFGSKGWKDAKGNKNNCPKPHVMGEVVEFSKGSFIRGSDIAVLKRELHKFLQIV
jgi:hypothetical protein